MILNKQGNPLLSLLKLPFHPHQIEWVVGHTFTRDGKTSASVLPYIRADEGIERFERVVGLDGFQTETRLLLPVGENGIGAIEYSISVLYNGTWVKRSDGAELTIKTDSKGIEGTFPVRGAFTDAFKRTANLGWGVGRYLRSPKKTVYVEMDGKYIAKGQESKMVFSYDCPLNSTDFKTRVEKVVDFNKAWEWLLFTAETINAYIPPKENPQDRAYDIYLSVITDALVNGFLE